MDTSPGNHIPTDVLKAYRLLDKVPLRALEADRRFSYTLYIPAKPYSSVHEHLHHPVVDLTDDEPSYGSRTEPLPLVVTIHGVDREVTACRDDLVPSAEMHYVAVLAPLFPVALDNNTDGDDYLILRNENVQFDLILIKMLDEVSKLWPGIDCQKCTFVGIKGGAEFIHRFAYVHPERVQALCIASMSEVTKIDNNLDSEDWPNGYANFKIVFGRDLPDSKALAKIKIVLIDTPVDKVEDRQRQIKKDFLASINSRHDKAPNSFRNKPNRKREKAAVVKKPETSLSPVMELRNNWLACKIPNETHELSAEHNIPLNIRRITSGLVAQMPIKSLLVTLKIKAPGY